MRPRLILSEEDEQKICNLYQSGISINNILKNYGFSQSVVLRILEKHEIETKSRSEAARGVARRKDHTFIPRKKAKITNINEETKNPIDCDTQGKACIYKTKISGGEWICNYICEVGHSRGCDPHQCTKYIIGRKRGAKHG